MSNDTILKDYLGARYSYDNIKNQGWLDGHMGGTDQVIAFINAKAVSLFSQRKHEAAREMQNLGDEILRDVRSAQETRAKEHRKEYPEILKVDV